MQCNARVAARYPDCVSRVHAIANGDSRCARIVCWQWRDYGALTSHSLHNQWRFLYLGASAACHTESPAGIQFRAAGRTLAFGEVKTAMWAIREVASVWQTATTEPASMRRVRVNGNRCRCRSRVARRQC